MSGPARYLDVLARHAEQTPDAVALRDASGALTYAQTWQAAQSVAAWLREQGVRTGDRVAIGLPPSAANLIVLFGAMAAGAVAAPVNISLRRAELTQYLSRIEPAIAIVGTRQAEHVDQTVVGSIVVLPTDAAIDGQADPLAVLQSLTARHAASLVAEPELDPNAPAIMFGTGGTTGLPKAAVWSHQALWLYGASCSAAMEVRRTDVELFFSPLFHIALVTGPFGTLFSGGTVHVLAGFDAGVVAELLGHGQITRMFGAPTALVRIIEHPGFDPKAMGSVRRLLFGSTRSEPDLIDRLVRAFPRAEFITGYGATEFGAVARLRSWEMVPEKDQGVGRPVPGVSFVIVDAEDAVLPVGHVGELIIRAPWQMLGYWRGGSDAEVHRDFVHGGVRSGDLGERDGEGNIHLRGRLKDIVITGGENVFPVEVEDALSSHPAVAAAAVVGVLDKEWGERVEAFVVLAGSVGVPARPTAETLTAYCRDRLARYKVPKGFHFVDELPLTSAMKVDKLALRKILADA